MRRILSVWFPRWSIERRLRRQHIAQRASLPNTTSSEVNGQVREAETAFALVVKGVRGVRITATNLPAEQEGVIIGQSLADARALCPNLMTMEATPELDQVALERLALWCLRYSPLVRCHEPDGVALDITGCDHLFGGEHAMMVELAHRLTAFHLTVRIGLADTIGGAWAAARFGSQALCRVPQGELKSFLRPVTIAALDLERDNTDQLEQLGLRQIGQLLDIPPAALITRFGQKMADRLLRVIGTHADIFNPLVLPTLYQVEQSLMEPVSHLEGVRLCLQTLSWQMQVHLKADGKGARQLELRLFRVDGHVERLCVGSSQLCDEAGYMQLLFDEILARLQSDVDLGYGIDFVSLSAFSVEDMQAEQRGWGGEAHATDQLRAMDQLFDRFGNRFGFDRVTRTSPYTSYIPERSYQDVPANAVSSKMGWGPNKAQHQERPLLLFRPPEPVTVLAEVPDGPPLRFEWRRRLHHITRAEGPERVAPEWWRFQDAGSRQTRDYYRVEDKEGHRFWLYRDGLYEREDDIPRWFVQGLFS